MTTQTLDNGRQITARGPSSNILSTIGVFFAAVADSLAAAHEYKRLVARGVQPTEAARRVFETKIAGQ
jgi:hypothetical protein